MKREDAILLLKEHVKNEGLFIHCIATAAIMRAAAARLGEDEDRWEIIGILHDIDFEEIGGDMSLHGDAGYEILTNHGIDEDIAGPVKRHNFEKYGDFDSPVDLALTAADNISGLITACALVKGGDVSAVTGKTIKKKIKDRSFAAGCNRDRIMMIEKYIEIPEFYEIAVSGVRSVKDEIGL